MFVALSINIQLEDGEKNVEESEISINSTLRRIFMSIFTFNDYLKILLLAVN